MRCGAMQWAVALHLHLYLHARDVRVVSASSSFFRFILSFRASASRRAT